VETIFESRYFSELIGVEAEIFLCNYSWRETTDLLVQIISALQDAH
jgi:hypothetical protein